MSKSIWWCVGRMAPGEDWFNHTYHSKAELKGGLSIHRTYDRAQPESVTKIIDLRTGETIFNTCTLLDEVYIATHEWPKREEALKKLKRWKPKPDTAPSPAGTSAGAS